MSSLRSALDELRAEDLRSLSDEALAGHLDEIERAGRVLEAERRWRVGESIADGYRRVPQDDDEVKGATRAAIRSIHEEPW